MKEAEAAIGVQLREGPTEAPHGAVGEVRRGSDAYVRKVLWPHGETPTVQASDGVPDMGQTR